MQWILTHLEFNV